MRGPDPIISNYLLRVVKTILVEDDFEPDILQQLTHEIYSMLIGPNSNFNTSDKLNLLVEYRDYIIRKSGSTARWNRLQRTVEDLLTIKDRDELAKYLIRLDSIVTDATSDTTNVQFDRDHQRQQSSRINPLTSPHINSRIMSSSPRVVSSASSGHPSMHNYRNQSSFTPKGSNLSFHGKTLSELVIPFYYSDRDSGLIKESDIIKNLMYTLNDLTSDMFPFDNDGIKIPVNISFGTSGLLHQLFEPALINRYLKKKLTNNRLATIKSQVIVAFLGCLQEELMTYTSLINSIFSQHNLDREVLTLRSVHLELIDPTTKLRFLFFLSTQADILPTNDFLSLLHNFTEFGDPLLKNLSNQLFKVCVKPYYEVLKLWLLEGTYNVEDGENEHFFVTASLPVESRNTYYSNETTEWLSNCTFLPNRVPSFLVGKTAESIYQIGKSLNFLKVNCNELKWCHEFAVQKSQLFHTCPQKLESLVESQYEQVINYLSYVIYEKYGFVKEIQYLHQFLLMSKGDFINSLIDKGLNLLHESSATLSSHSLMRVLQDSVENSSVKDYPKDVIDRLDARLLEMGHGNIGWEVFTLDFQIKHPINMVLNERSNSSREYLRMFNFLLKLQKLSYLLNLGWTEANSLRKTGLKQIEKRAKSIKLNLRMNPTYTLTALDSRCLWLSKTFKRLNILRNEFVKFINIVTSFFDLEIIEKSYTRLMSTLKKNAKDELPITKNERGVKCLVGGRMPIDSNFLSQWSKLPSADLDTNRELIDLKYNSYNLDELADLHHSYITSITCSRILQTQPTKSSSSRYIYQIDSFINTINRFVDLNSEFNSLLVEMISVTELLKDDDLMENRDQYDDYLNRVDAKLNKLMENLTIEIIENFEDSLEKFTEALSVDKDQSLRFLGIMLSN
ncbi:hypothetical protein CANARDRAFT_28747 [[Candida] arabinofermentans NRRL YB-2248]|uniref:Spindle pole body component n=1 Tax=[Candida] arabinofermentans NRRL YB-2248 TaxID=983967 RepID=A0A1E4SZV9_9ASCO|nr:hypothetical protein CANARDRAFT_28747 [[Candida] arabinofermentans NRRL YB-2248]